MNLQQRAAPIELMLSDVDGVLTDGSVVFDNQGIETKKFHIADGLGIQLWRRAGYRFGMITGRSSHIVRLRAAELGVELVRQGVEDKLAVVQQVVAELGLAAASGLLSRRRLARSGRRAAVGLGVAVADGCEELAPGRTLCNPSPRRPRRGARSDRNDLESPRPLGRFRAKIPRPPGTVRRAADFVIRHSCFFRHSSFDIRHFPVVCSMLDRLRRTTIGFGVVMAAYTAYRVTAVPFLEPSVAPPTQAAAIFHGKASNRPAIRLDASLSARLVAAERSDQAGKRPFDLVDEGLSQSARWPRGDVSLLDRLLPGRFQRVRRRGAARPRDRARCAGGSGRPVRSAAGFAEGENRPVARSAVSWPDDDSRNAKPARRDRRYSGHHAKRADEHRTDLDARAGRLSLRTKHRPRPRFANASSPFGPCGRPWPRHRRHSNDRSAARRSDAAGFRQRRRHHADGYAASRRTNRRPNSAAKPAEEKPPSMSNGPSGGPICRRPCPISRRASGSRQARFASRRGNRRQRCQRRSRTPSPIRRSIFAARENFISTWCNTLRRSKIRSTCCELRTMAPAIK